MRDRLCRSAADLFQLAGEVFFDADRSTDAAHSYTVAASAAKECGEHDLWACALTRHAYLCLYDDRPTEAAPLLEVAAVLARRGDTALATRHWGTAVQAEAYAAAGADADCERALDTAATVADLTPEASNGRWLRFDGSRLAEQRGTCLLRLGRLDRAETALNQARSAPLSPRRDASILTDLAMVGIHRRDPDQIAAFVRPVLEAARRTGSSIITTKLARLRPHLGAFPVFAVARSTE